MSDPSRLIDSGASDFERLLLGAAAEERPSPGQRNRMRRALWLAQFGILGTSLKAFAGLGHHVAVVTMIATALVSGASSPIQPIELSRSASTVSDREIVTPTRDNAADLGASSSALADAANTTFSPGDDLPKRSRLGPANRSVPPSRRGSDLRDEIALMDQARAALRQGSPARTLAAVEQYRSSFAHGTFDQEALVLRIEALEAIGNRSRAAAEADVFLARNPNSPHRDRLQRVLGRCSSRSQE
jgi:hypothetical protein